MAINLNKLKHVYLHSPILLKRLFSHIPWSYRMGSEYRKTYSFLERSLYWSKQKWKDYQTDKLRSLMLYCYNTVPFYQSLFKDHKINPNAHDIWKEYYKIPIIDKEKVANNIESFLPLIVSKSKIYSATTGGTTGKPMQIYYEPRSYGREWAYKIFFWNLAIGYRPTNKKATFRGVSLADDLYVENPVYNEIRFSPFHLDNNHIERIVKKFLDYKPEYIHGYPSALEQLAKYFLKNDIHFNNIKGAILISENIFPYQRELIAKAFRCKVYSFYGHSERLIFASMGPGLNQYYAHPAYGITELIDESGRPIKDVANNGELVGTGFINLGMPLLRFRTGDYSTWVKPSSPIEMPALGYIKGRWNQEYLIGRNGKKVSLTALNMHSNVYKKVRNMQYVQNILGVVIINIIADREYNKEDENYIKKEHMDKLGNQFTIKFNYVDSLERTKAGKMKFLVQNLDLDV